MKISGQKVFSNSEQSTMVAPGTRECIVSFDASWHRRGHFSNQGFAGAIDSSTGKVLDYALYDRVCSLCSKWDEDRKLQNPDDFAAFWKNTAPLPLLITRRVPKQWKHPQHWRFVTGP